MFADINQTPSLASHDLPARPFRTERPVFRIRAHTHGFAPPPAPPPRRRVSLSLHTHTHTHKHVPLVFLFFLALPPAAGGLELVLGLPVLSCLSEETPLTLASEFDESARGLFVPSPAPSSPLLPAAAAAAAAAVLTDFFLAIY